MRVFISRLVEIGVKLQDLQRVLNTAAKPSSNLFRVLGSFCLLACLHPLPFQNRHKYNAFGWTPQFLVRPLRPHAHGSNLVKSLWEPVEAKDEWTIMVMGVAECRLHWDLYNASFVLLASFQVFVFVLFFFALPGHQLLWLSVNHRALSLWLVVLSIESGLGRVVSWAFIGGMAWHTLSRPYTIFSACLNACASGGLAYFVPVRVRGLPDILCHANIQTLNFKL